MATMAVRAITHSPSLDISGKALRFIASLRQFYLPGGSPLMRAYAYTHWR